MPRFPLGAPSSAATASSASTPLKDCVILAGAGVGGGSLVYANTLYEPLAAVLRRPAVGAHHRLARRARAALRPGQADARRRHQPGHDAADERDEAGRRRARRRRHLPPDAGRRVLRRARARSRADRVADPYFGGAGPDRTGCIDCGECMTGCRHGAKNTLVKNYLYLAEQAGARVHPLTTVTGVEPATGGGYAVDTCVTGRWTVAGATGCSPPSRSCSRPARYGTQKLLHRLRTRATCRGSPTGSGYLTRTNSESMLGAIAPDAARSTTPRASRSRRRSTRTSTPTSSRSATARAATRWALLQTRAHRRRRRGPRWRTWLTEMCDTAGASCRPARPAPLVGADRDHPAGDAVRDNSITVLRKRGRLRPPHADLAAGRTASRTRPGSRSPTEAAARMAENIDGIAGRHRSATCSTSR